MSQAAPPLMSPGPLVAGDPPVPRRGPEPVGFALRDRHVALVIGLVSLAVFGLAARIRRLHSSLSGDEPHYLIINTALQKYGSLDVMRVYENRDYWSFYPGAITPHVAPGPHGLLSWHSIGGPLLWHLPYLVLGRTGAVAFIGVVSMLTVVNVFYFLRETGIAQLYAGIVAALFAIGSPIYVYATMLFIEPIAALAILFAVRMVCRPTAGRWRMAVASAGLGALPWVHPRFIIFSGLIGGLLAWRLWRQRSDWRLYLWALGPLAVLLAALEVYNLVVWHSLDFAANMSSVGASAFQVAPHTGLAGLLLDRSFGLVPNFPLLLLAVPGVLLAFGQGLRRDLQRANVAILLTIVPYLLAVSTFAEWWGGFSPPGRYLAAVTPLLALYVAVFLQRVNHLAATAGAVVLAAVSLALGVIGDLNVVLRFNWPYWSDQQGQALDRLGALVGLDPARFVPSSFLPGQTAAFGWWLAALTGLSAGLWFVAHRRPPARRPPARRPYVSDRTSQSHTSSTR